MIATILPSSANFAAVAYNQKKVQAGVAQLLEIRNFPQVATHNPTAEWLTSYLQAYSAKNTRIVKPQLHVAFSCRGHEWTEAQLVDFAHKWLGEMGYDDPGQPLLIYAHRDTDNTHIHVVTSRVNPQGHKVDHNHERRRSQAVIDKILMQDPQERVSAAVEAALDYRFATVTQFKAVLESQGYSCYEQDGKICFARGGSAQGSISIAEIQCRFNDSRDDSRMRQIRVLVRKEQGMASSRKELEQELRRKFGLSPVFFGRADKPYGYMVVDHNTRQVFNGAQVMKIKDLLSFMPVQERFDRCDMMIQQQLAINPLVTTREINRKLRRQLGACLTQGCVKWGSNSMPINPGIIRQLKNNNRVAWVQRFNPATADERDALCAFFNISNPAAVSFGGRTTPLPTGTIDDLNRIFGGNDPRGSLRACGFGVVNNGGSVYAIDFNRRAVVNLTKAGYNTQQPVAGKRHGLNGRRHSGDISAYGRKREWEIREGIDELQGQDGMKL